MTVDQAVQNSYMAPNAFKDLNRLDLKSLADKTKNVLVQLDQKCPQSPNKDRSIYQYKHTLNVIEKIMN